MIQHVFERPKLTNHGETPQVEAEITRRVEREHGVRQVDFFGAERPGFFGGSHRPSPGVLSLWHTACNAVSFACSR